MMFNESHLGPTPQSLQAVDEDLAGKEDLRRIKLQVPIPTEHQAVVNCESVRVDDAASLNLIDSHSPPCAHRDVWDNRDMNPAVRLENPNKVNLYGFGGDVQAWGLSFFKSTGSSISINFHQPISLNLVLSN